MMKGGIIDYKSISDAELAFLLKTESDQAAFTEIYNRYWVKLFLHAKHMLSDDDQAQDLVQEVFSWIWQQHHTLQLNESISSYLYGSVRNKVLNQIKHEKVKAVKLNDISAFLSTNQTAVDEELSYKELVSMIEEEINLMPPKMREIFELSRNSYLSHKLIAEKLGISEQTVRKQIQRALRQLRTRIKIQVPVLIYVLVMLKKV